MFSCFQRVFLLYYIRSYNFRSIVFIQTLNTIDFAAI